MTTFVPCTEYTIICRISKLTTEGGQHQEMHSAAQNHRTVNMAPQTEAVVALLPGKIVAAKVAAS